MAYTSSNVSCGIDNYLQCGYNKTRELMLKGDDTPLCSGTHRGEEPLEELCVCTSNRIGAKRAPNENMLWVLLSRRDLFFFVGGVGLNKAHHQKRESSRTTVQPSGSVQWRLVVQEKTPTECIKLAE